MSKSRPALGFSTLEEERATVASAKAGNEDAVVRLLTSQTRFIRSEALKYGAASGVDHDDLISAAQEAILLALKAFDETQEVRFLSFVPHLVREAMADELASMGASLPVPGRTMRRYRKAMRDADGVQAARRLARERDGMDTETFDAVHFALSGQSIDESHETSDRVSSNGYGGDASEAVMFGGVGNTLTTESNLLGSRGEAPEASAVKMSLVRQAAAVLDDTQRAVVYWAYFAPGEDLSHREIAEKLGLSRVKVTRTLASAHAAMRSALSA